MKLASTHHDGIRKRQPPHWELLLLLAVGPFSLPLILKEAKEKKRTTQKQRLMKEEEEKEQEEEKENKKAEEEEKGKEE